MGIKQILGKIGSAIVKVLKGAGKVAWRYGMDQFLENYLPLAMEEITKLAAVKGNDSFHQWRDEAFDAVKARLDADKASYQKTWITILLGFALESLKANGLWPLAEPFHKHNPVRCHETDLDGISPFVSRQLIYRLPVRHHRKAAGHSVRRAVDHAARFSVAGRTDCRVVIAWRHSQGGR